ncbi:MAG: DUF1015 domain-containing protein [Actinomycetota bacterium]|nr:DUF1015 domain-containing protein [Actinomycetota bacterium]
MPELRPFSGLRYASADRLGDLLCPPYDVISAEERERLYDLDPHNAIHLELPRGDDEERYERAGSAFEEWARDGVLKSDDRPSLYVYRQDFTAPDGSRRRVAGVIGALELEAFGATSGVLPHERTMPGPKKDRLALMKALPANVSPIFAIYRGEGGVAPFYDSLENRPPDARVADRDGILHRLWVVKAPAEVAMLSDAIRPGPLVIADGHHRYETALAFRDERPGNDASSAIMCFCVDADVEELVVLPYHRGLRGVGVDLEQALHASGGRELSAGEVDGFLAGASGHPFVFVLPGATLGVEVSYELVERRLAGRAEAWRALDVVVLHEVVLADVLSDGAEEMTFTKDPDEVVRLVREEGWDAGVLLRGLHPAEVVDVARSGERMPQKASYFWPKAVTGLVFRPTR